LIFGIAFQVKIYKIEAIVVSCIIIENTRRITSRLFKSMTSLKSDTRFWR